MEDDLRWKTAFDGRQPLMEDNLRWKTTFDRVFSILPEKFFTTPHLDGHSKTDPNRKSYQLSKPEKEYHVMEEMYTASLMCMYAEKTTFLEN